MSLRRLLARTVAGLALAAFLVPSLAAAAAFAPLPPLTATCLGAGGSHAAVVVQHANGAVVTRCVAFSGASISGEALLEASGLDFRVQPYGGFGDAICRVDFEPKAYSDCLGKDYYWALFVAAPGGTWQFATTGISNATIRDGGAEGFRYEPQTGTAAAPPAPAGVCAAAQATPRPSPTPVATRPAPTPVPATPVPSTPAPTAARSATPSPAAGSLATAAPATASIDATTTSTPTSTPAPSGSPSPPGTPATSTANAAAHTTGTGGSGGGSGGGVPLGTMAAAAGGTALAALLVLRGLRGRGAAR